MVRFQLECGLIDFHAAAGDGETEMAFECKGVVGCHDDVDSPLIIVEPSDRFPGTLGDNCSAASLREQVQMTVRRLRSLRHVTSLPLPWCLNAQRRTSLSAGR
jgi:hypothetical protein